MNVIGYRMDTGYKEILANKYDEFGSEENRKRKKFLRTGIFDILHDIKEPDSEDYHIWGLTYYMTDNDREYNRNQALKKFMKAYELDSSNFLACLYIAHCLHDKRELQNALKFYELVDKKELREFQIWRYVKLIEQIGFCHYQLGNEVLGRKYFQEVLGWYEKLPDEERAVPLEMFQCLPESDEIIIRMKALEDYLD